MPRKYTDQETFDIVYKALTAQGCASMGVLGACAYRAYKNDAKCAYGHLIADEDYHDSIEGIGLVCVSRGGEVLPDGQLYAFQKEGTGSTGYVNLSNTVSKLGYEDGDDITLLVDLQQAHDGPLVVSFAGWQDAMAKIATKYSLTIPSLA